MTRADTAGGVSANRAAKLWPSALSQSWLPPGEPLGAHHSRPVAGAGSRGSGGPGWGKRGARSDFKPARSEIILRTTVVRLSADSSAVQSTQLIGLSWQYALVLACWVRLRFSPARSVGLRG